MAKAGAGKALFPFHVCCCDKTTEGRKGQSITESWDSSLRREPQGRRLKAGMLAVPHSITSKEGTNFTAEEVQQKPMRLAARSLVHSWLIHNATRCLM